MHDEITMEKVATITAICILILINLFVWFMSWTIVVLIFFATEINFKLISVAIIFHLFSAFSLNKTYIKLKSVVKV